MSSNDLMYSTLTFYPIKLKKTVSQLANVLFYVMLILYGNTKMTLFSLDLKTLHCI